MTREHAKHLIEVYGRAWVTQDPELILSIFTKDATYNDPHEALNVGQDAIRKYWQTKVVEQEKDIHFSVRNIWVDGDVVIAEWDAQFIDTKNNVDIQMTEVAIFTVEGDKFSSLREYYSTVKTPR